MKKYLTDNFGYTLRNIRENLKLTQTEVFQGILARSTWYNYEAEIIDPDMLTFITLLERMGVSADRFEFIVPEEVHRFFTWYEECLTCIEHKDWEGLIDKRNKFEVLKQINVKIQYQYRDFIDYVIERFGNLNSDKAIIHIKQALLCTITDIDNVVSDRLLLSVFEGHLLANYYDLLYSVKADDSITKELYLFYEYYSNRLNDDLIKGIIIPRIALILLKHDRNVLSREERLKIEQEVLEILIKNHAIRELPELLDYLINDEFSYGMSKIRIFQRNALLAVFDIYEVCSDFRVEIQRFERKKYLLLSDVLRLRRLELGLTIEEAAGDICAVSTYARAETGKTTPNKNTLSLLKERLKLRAVHYSSEIETEEYSILMLNSECRRLAATGKFDEAELKYNELSDKLDMSIPVNKQILEFSNIYVSSAKENNLAKLWELLSYNEVKFEKRILFSREELEILSLIAWEEEKVGQEKGIKLLEDVIERECRQRGTYYSRTAIIKRNMVRMLKDSKHYERSHKLAAENIINMFTENESGLLINMLDYISTIEEEVGDEEAASEICKLMFYISELYKSYNAAEGIREYFEENFNKEEIWY